jgi:hypothetical protein
VLTQTFGSREIHRLIVHKNIALQMLTKGVDMVYDFVIQESYQMKEFAIRDRDGRVYGSGQMFQG